MECLFVLRIKIHNIDLLDSFVLKFLHIADSDFLSYSEQNLLLVVLSHFWGIYCLSQDFLIQAFIFCRFTVDCGFFD